MVWLSVIVLFHSPFCWLIPLVGMGSQVSDLLEGSDGFGRPYGSAGRQIRLDVVVWRGA